MRRVVFGSSAVVFGSGGGPTADDRSLAPPSVYGASKTFAEQLAGAMIRDDPGLELQQIIEGFALDRECLAHLAYPEPKDWTYVDDAVEAIVRCLASPRPSVVACSVSGDFRPVGDAVRHLRRRFPTVLAEPIRARLPANVWNFTSDRIIAEADYRPRVKFETGLDRTVDAIRQADGLPFLSSRAA